MGRPVPPLSLTDDERETLKQWARRPKTVQSLAQRARIILASAEGNSNTAIADNLRMWRGCWESPTRRSANGALAFCTRGLMVCWMNRDLARLGDSVMLKWSEY